MTRISKIGWIAIAITGTIFSSDQAGAQGRVDVIAQTGQTAPDGNGSYSHLNFAQLNDLGQLAFWADLTGTSGGPNDAFGIFRGSGGSITQIARAGQAAPDGDGSFAGGFNFPLLNESGQAAFWATLTGANDQGIFLGSGGGLTQIVRKGQAAPDFNGTFLSLSNSPSVNNAGQAAFFANLAGTSGGTSDDEGVFRGSGGGLTQIARAGQAAPDGNGSFANFNFPGINNAGQVAFQAALTGTSGGGNSGVFRGSGGSLTQIARAGQAAPDGNGIFSNFSPPSINDSGQTAFAAFLVGSSISDDNGIFRGSGGSITQIARVGQLAPDGASAFTLLAGAELNNSGEVAFLGFLSNTVTDQGIFRGNGGSLAQVARTGQLAPDGNGSLFSFGGLTMNESNQVAFLGTLTGTTDDQGIFTGDGIDFLKVIRKGDSLAGGIVTSVFHAQNDWLNEHGQIAYSATLNNGNQIVSRWTPDLHWRSTVSGTWDAGSHWTLGLNPASMHDVYLDPAASVTVDGPGSSKTVRSLQIGGGSGLATLKLANGSVLTSSNGVSIQSTGILTGDGSIAGNVLNNGYILAQNVTIAGNLFNNSVIEGHGRIHANVDNSASGEIRALTGNTIRMTGASFSNSGLVEVHGGELRVTSVLQNNTGSGLISLRNGSLIASAGINNTGGIALSQGTSTIRGDISNAGTIQVSGGAHATFFDDLAQNGTLQVASVGSTKSTAVMLGAFSGSGGFVGGGDVFALGDLRPGNSTASVTYDGNLFLGASTHSFIELGGLALGDFDQMVVTGDFNLAGGLFVSLESGYSLGLNQQYRIGEVGGNLLGQFNGLSEGALVGNFGGQELFISYAAGGGNGITLFTVPEPGSLIVLSLGSVLIVLRRRRAA